MECAALFDAVVACGEPGTPRQLKPSPGGLLDAARQLGMSARDCLMIGDRPEVDGEAARRAGMAYLAPRAVERSHHTPLKIQTP